jgi:dipeptidyl-peptidase-4
VSCSEEFRPGTRAHQGVPRRLSLTEAAALPPAADGPLQVRLLADRRTVTYLAPEAAGSTRLALWRLDPHDDTPRLVVAPPPDRPRSLAETLRRERVRWRFAGISAYQLDGGVLDGTLLCVADGHAYLRHGDRLAPASALDGVAEPTLLPGGRAAVGVADGSLVAVDLANGTRRVLAAGGPSGVTCGLAEYAAQEELGRSEGYWVDAAGRRVAFCRVDCRALPDFVIPHAADDPLAAERHPYPFAGGPNAAVSVGVVGVDGGAVTWLDPPWPPETAYVARVAWLYDDRLAVMWLDRPQRRLEWRLYDPDRGGAGELRLWEDGDPWVSVTDDTHFLGSGEVVTTSAPTGDSHLILWPADGGPPHALTSGAWQVLSVLAVDAAARTAYVAANRDGPLHTGALAVPLDGGVPRPVTAGCGQHAVTVLAAAGLFLDRHDSLRQGVAVSVRRLSDGSAVRAPQAAPPATAEDIGVSPPEMVRVPAADGTPLYGAVYRPEGPAPAGGYPAVVSVYGGPAAQVVRDTWLLTVDLESQYLAQHGVLVFKLDGRGSAHRGLAFERPIHRRFAGAELADQVAGVSWLVSQRGVNPRRVAICGWSYGGFLTLTALLRAPEVFACGVAGAPVTDFAGYDTAYTERYLGTPEDNPDGYRHQSLVPLAAGLRRPVLIIHGLLDENVHFRHTVRFIAAAQAAGRRVDLMVLPGARHSAAASGPDRQAVIARRTAFVRHHLGVRRDPAEPG